MRADLSRLYEFIVRNPSAFSVGMGPDGDQQVVWHGPDPQPSDGDLDAAAADGMIVEGQAYSQWRAERGGDPVVTRRRLAREQLAEATADNIRLRAAFLELLEHFNRIAQRHNTLAAQHDALLSWLGTQTALTDRGALSSFASPPPVPEPTPAQALNAIVDRINAGTAEP